MAKYTLTYFDSVGRAQASRYMFSLAGVEFKDTRLQFGEWPQHKDSMPLKVIPVLDVEGYGRIVQTGAIDRFVAKKCNFLGDNEADIITVDQVHTTLLEALDQFVPYFTGANDEAKEAFRVKLTTEILPKFLTFLTKKLEENGGGDGYFVGSKPTLADLAWASFGPNIKMVDKDNTVAPAYPKLFALLGRVLDLPEIKAFDEQHKK